MSAEPTPPPRKGVILLRLGTGVEEFELPEGATLADVLNAANVDPARSEVMIDGKSMPEAIVLKPGAIVSVGPKVSVPEPPWRATLGMLRDAPGFDEMMRGVEARRAANSKG